MGWRGGEVQTNEGGGEGNEAVEIGACLGEQNMCEYAVFLNIFSGKPSVILIVF